MKNSSFKGGDSSSANGGHYVVPEKTDSSANPSLKGWDPRFEQAVRVGLIVEVHDFPEARKPAYKLTIDFGSAIGKKRSSAQITHHYSKEELLGKLVLAVVNFPPRQIGPFLSEVLTLGVPDEQGQVILVEPDKASAIIGGRLF